MDRAAYVECSKQLYDLLDEAMATKAQIKLARSHLVGMPSTSMNNTRMMFRIAVSSHLQVRFAEAHLPLAPSPLLCSPSLVS